MQLGRSLRTLLVMANQWLHDDLKNMMQDDAGLRPDCPFAFNVHLLSWDQTSTALVDLNDMIQKNAKNASAVPAKCWNNCGQWHPRWPEWKSRRKQTRDEVTAMLVELGSMSTLVKCFVQNIEVHFLEKNTHIYYMIYIYTTYHHHCLSRLKLT